MEIIGEGASNPQASITIDPSGLDDLKCECGNYTFTAVFLFKIVPAIVSPTGKEGLSPQQVFACNRCGEIPSRFLKGKWFKDSGDDENDATQPTTPNIESD